MVNYQTRAQIKQRAKMILRNNFLPLLLLGIVINIDNIKTTISNNVETLQAIQIYGADAFAYLNQPQPFLWYTSIVSMLISLIIVVLCAPFIGLVLDIVRSPQPKATISWDAFDVVKNPKFWITIFVCGFVEVFVIFFASLLFIIPGIIVAIFFALTNYVLIDIYRSNRRSVNINGKVFDTGDVLSPLYISWNLISGHAMDYFILTLSFIPWYLLAVITFGLSQIYSLPYIMTTHAVWYNELLKEKGLLVSEDVLEYEDILDDNED